MLRLALVVCAGLLLAGCSGPCTLIGCQNTVNFQLGAAGQHFGANEAVQVRACVGTQCTEETLTQEAGGSSSSTGPAFWFNSGTLVYRFNSAIPASATVSLELKKNGSVVFSDSRDGVAFGSFQPNGPGCAPNCQQATVTL